MSLLLNLGSTPAGLEASACPREFWLSGYCITHADFCELVKYFLANTDLEPDDPRPGLIRLIRTAREVPGWNPGGTRIEMSSKSALKMEYDP